MGHSHHHHHPHSGHDHHASHAHGTTGSLGVAFGLNLFFTVVEIVGGLYTGSIAILSDAVHDLGDTLAIGLAWIFEKLSGKGRDGRYTYGYRRFSTFSAFLTSTILFTGSVLIIYEAIPRLINPQPVKASGMLMLAILGVVANGIAVLRLGKGQDSLNRRAVRLHLLEDVLGWVAVLLGSVVIYFTEWWIIDPILSLAIGVYILVNVVKTLKQVGRVFLQAVPEGCNLAGLEDDLDAMDEISSFHDLHIWSLDGHYVVLTTHIVVPDDLSYKQITDVKRRLKDLFKHHKIDHFTIEIEKESEQCAFADC